MRHGLLITGLLLVLTSCYGTLSETEPENNKRKQAQLYRADQVFEGSYYSKSGRDIDYLFLPVDKGHMIRGKLSGVKGINGEILLFKPDKREPFKIINDSLSSLGEEFGPLWIDPPGVVMAIRPKRNVNQRAYAELNYSYTVNAFAPSTPIEYEPNDTLGQAQEIDQGTILGYYSNVFANPKRLERDFFYLDIKESKKYSVKIALSGVAGIDTILRIYSKQFKKLKIIDEKGVGQGETLLSYGINGPNKLYLSVTAKDHKINASQYYEVKTTLSEYESKYELEPNDTIAKASPLTEDKTFGEISDRHDRDYYRFKNENTWPVQLSLTIVPDDNLNPRIEYTASPKKRRRLFDDGGREETEGISNRIVGPKQSVHLKVFTLDWEGSEALPYKILLKSNQLVDNVELEPNDNRKTANEVVPDSSVVGYVNPNLDQDYFRFKAKKQGKYKILLDGVPDCRLSLSVADRYGYITRNRISKSMGDGISLTGRIEPRGFIIVSCKQGKENLFASPYSMTIQSRKNWE